MHASAAPENDLKCGCQAPERYVVVALDLCQFYSRFADQAVQQCAIAGARLASGGTANVEFKLRSLLGIAQCAFRAIAAPFRLKDVSYLN